MHVPQMLNEAYHYEDPSCAFSRGMRCRLGDTVLLFLSGTASVDHRGRSIHAGDFKAQARRMYANLTALLESEGATWHDVVKILIFIADMRYYRAFNEVRTAFFRSQRLRQLPASSCVEARLCRPDLMLESELIAVLPVSRAKSRKKRK
ncbi:MAG TPA: RidA family protein [Verrucomicrobiae bacterium]|nr:RidA family protein [Verrucomicrobiae bacterium]